MREDTINSEEKNSMRNYLQKQIIEIPTILNEELSYNNQPFNQRNDFEDITQMIDDLFKWKKHSSIYCIAWIKRCWKNNNIISDI